MKCPKCNAANPPGATECESCAVQFKDLKRGSRSAPVINLNCAWHSGCGLRGSMSDCTNGAGPWYCSEHYWLLKGQKPRLNPPVSYRETWYRQHKTADQLPGTGNVGDYAPAIREPGEDSEEQAA